MAFFNKRSPAEIIEMAVCGCMIMGVIDYLTGDIAFSVFYLGPVALVAWYAGRRAGVAMSAFSVIVWMIADVSSGHLYGNLTIPLWNTGIRFAFLLINVLLLDALRVQLETAERLSLLDPLTEILNTRAFTAQLQSTIALAQRDETPMTLVYIDVDNFKQVNDTLGHFEGDQKLRAIGRVLRDSTRQTDSVARLGGDEFGMLFPHTGLPGAQTLIAKLVQQLAVVDLEGSHLTCSIGAITFSKPPATSTEAMQLADALMYTVKKEGKNAVAFGTFDGMSCVQKQVMCLE